MLYFRILRIFLQEYAKKQVISRNFRCYLLDFTLTFAVIRHESGYYIIELFAVVFLGYMRKLVNNDIIDKLLRQQHHFIGIADRVPGAAAPPARPCEGYLYLARLNAHYIRKIEGAFLHILSGFSAQPLYIRLGQLDAVLPGLAHSAEIFLYPAGVLFDKFADSRIRHCKRRPDNDLSLPGYAQGYRSSARPYDFKFDVFHDHITVPYTTQQKYLFNDKLSQIPALVNSNK